jgi:hypothetical protein
LRSAAPWLDCCKTSYKTPCLRGWSFSFPALANDDPCCFLPPQAGENTQHMDKALCLCKHRAGILSALHAAPRRRRIAVLITKAFPFCLPPPCWPNPCCRRAITPLLPAAYFAPLLVMQGFRVVFVTQQKNRRLACSFYTFSTSSISRFSFLIMRFSSREM